MMPAVWLRFRAELRRRWRAWLVLAALVGFAGGTVIAAATGARRTDTAYDRFLSSQRAVDVLVGCQPADQAAPDVTPSRCATELMRLPQVLDAVAVTSFGP